MSIRFILTERARAFAGVHCEELGPFMSADFAETTDMRIIDGTIFDEDGKVFDILSILFHTAEFNGHEYIMSPANGALVIDICTRTEMNDPVKVGPFKGMKLLMPDIEGSESGDD